MKKFVCLGIVVCMMMFAAGCKKAVRPDGSPAPEPVVSGSVADTQAGLVLITVAAGDFGPQADAWLYSDGKKFNDKTTAYDDGTNGDKVAGDGVYTVVMNGEGDNNTVAGWTKWGKVRNVVMYDKYDQKAKSPRPVIK
ncbi:choice-of-anchor X domain-containing protein [Maridesulfovibrio sp.]|uniref:choice-of-anchor X domain-containing protein n=1 Tax=Maridesulfovibrio sp. TaxID=2795000 RepID=UPI0029CA4C3B|nr:choice-of-anchor X domain-containing protein [Maridesulfovibrio sp.]